MIVNGQGKNVADSGNRLVGPGPAMMSTGYTRINGVKVAVITMRTTSTTLTIFANKDDVQLWANTLAGLAAGMTNLVTGNGTPVSQS